MCIYVYISAYINTYMYIYFDDCFHYHFWRNDVEIAFGTLVFSYLASNSGVVCVVCPFADDAKHSCRSSVISMRSYPPQYPRSSTPLNPSPSLFLFLVFFFSLPFPLIFLFPRPPSLLVLSPPFPFFLS